MPPCHNNINIYHPVIAPWNTVMLDRPVIPPYHPVIATYHLVIHPVKLSNHSIIPSGHSTLPSSPIAWSRPSPLLPLSYRRAIPPTTSATPPTISPRRQQFRHTAKVRQRHRPLYFASHTVARIMTPLSSGADSRSGSIRSETAARTVTVTHLSPSDAMARRL